MKVENGSKVFLDYEGKFENGEVFDSSSSGSPLEFIAGSGQVIPGFDAAVLGMDEGEEKEFEIEPKDAYGEINEELKKEIPKSALPQDKTPEAGMSLVMNAPNGQQIPAKISEVTEESVIVDLNHPLAGKKLIFKIKVVKVHESPAEEIEEEVEEIMEDEIQEEVEEVNEENSEKEEESNEKEVEEKVEENDKEREN